MASAMVVIPSTKSLKTMAPMKMPFNTIRNYSMSLNNMTANIPQIETT